jgi:hypothetical protein
MFWNERLNTWNTALVIVFSTCWKASAIHYMSRTVLTKGMNTEVIFKAEKWPNICGKHPDKFEQASCVRWYFSWNVMVLSIMCLQSMLLTVLGIMCLQSMLLTVLGIMCLQSMLLTVLGSMCLEHAANGTGCVTNRRWPETEWLALPHSLLSRPCSQDETEAQSKAIQWYSTPSLKLPAGS